MACGTPTLAARASSLPEVVEDKALLFDPYDPLELAQSLFDLLSDPERAKKLGRKGLRHAAKFSWEKTAAETVGVYEKLFGN